MQQSKEHPFLHQVRMFFFRFDLRLDLFQILSTFSNAYMHQRSMQSLKQTRLTKYQDGFDRPYVEPLLRLLAQRSY